MTTTTLYKRIMTPEGYAYEPYTIDQALDEQKRDFIAEVEKKKGLYRARDEILDEVLSILNGYTA